MTEGLLVALGVAVAGGLGSMLRLVVDTAASRWLPRGFGAAIVLVNVTGSFALGVAAGLLDPGPALDVVGTGLLGGYTTFSTAAVDGARLALRGRGGRAVAHAVGTAVVCVAAATTGLVLTR